MKDEEQQEQYVSRYRFLIIRKWWHHEFGCTKTECKSYQLSEYKQMEKDLQRLTANDAPDQHTYVVIAMNSFDERRR